MELPTKTCRRPLRRVCVQGGVAWVGDLGLSSAARAQETRDEVLCVAAELRRVPGVPPRARVMDSAEESQARMRTCFGALEGMVAKTKEQHGHARRSIICCKEGRNRSAAFFVRYLHKHRGMDPDALIAELRAKYNPHVLRETNFAVPAVFMPFVRAPLGQDPVLVDIDAQLPVVITVDDDEE